MAGSANTMLERYQACMVLGAIGDSLAFRNGEWEFQRDGRVIHEELNKLHGIENLTNKNLRYSDDTVMHLATAKALIKSKASDSIPSICNEIAREYVLCMEDMDGRAPGITCIRGAKLLKPDTQNGYFIPFDRAGGGCGGAMRSMCIGLRYPSEQQEHLLIAIAIESGRMTHNHPTGYLGSLASALFTAYAIRGVPVKTWGKMLIDALVKAQEYVKSCNRDVEEAITNWGYFTKAWTSYLAKRGITDGVSEPQFPEKYGVVERDAFYKSVSWDGWGGSSGHDAPMIAYDALLGAKDNWKELTLRGFFHGGDSDSTGIIAGCWFGALYGYHGVFKANLDDLEKKGDILEVGKALYDLVYPDDK